MPKRKTPEEQNAHIKRMTSRWGTPPYPLPPAKVKPMACEHCDETMTVTGQLPPVKDFNSWLHWFNWEVGEHGVQKVHTANLSSGHCCVPCARFFDECDKEYAEDR